MCGLRPAAAGPQLPSSVPDCFSAAVHAWQSVVQGVSQQTPSTQLPLAHALPMLHALAFVRPYDSM
jgi:hypothetical protein